ncbi:MAG: L-glutamate gamma-semialdehyde dehydrogenase [Myxococcota bacterium]
MATAPIPSPSNEPVCAYLPGSSAREELNQALSDTAAHVAELPVLIAGGAIRTGNLAEVRMPHDHGHVLAKLHQAGADDVQKAIDGALRIAPEWANTSFETRAAIFLRAADLIAGPYRAKINAACMLGQSKTCHQAEIDAACELIDFLRFNVSYAEQLQAVQPVSEPGLWNRVDYRPLEGFVLAITPFNFLAIAANLPTAPAILGNVVLWKPATVTGLGVQVVMEILTKAGLPEGVISVIPGAGPEQGRVALESPHLAGIHFTGSTATFQHLYQETAKRIGSYRTYPRLVGETGGKDFIVAHPSAELDALCTSILRGSFEYQGQKCSAASRLYLPKSLWPRLQSQLVDEIKAIKMGDVRDFSNFMGAVIDERAFLRIQGYLSVARESAQILAGGSGDRSKGWFIEPTLVEVKDPKHQLMREEIFGPIVTAYVYEDSAFEEVLQLVDTTSPYGLTGAICARDRQAIELAASTLRNAAGNFYINDKPTGAVVGQQPFGGGRASGTNDKAGSIWNMTRWVSPRTIKENFVPPTHWSYPFLR